MAEKVGHLEMLGGGKRGKSGATGGAGAGKKGGGNAEGKKSGDGVKKVEK